MSTETEDARKILDFIGVLAEQHPDNKQLDEVLHAFGRRTKLPPEPPIGAMLVSHDGDLWQRTEGGWYSAALASTDHRWADIQCHAPFRRVVTVDDHWVVPKLPPPDIDGWVVMRHGEPVVTQRGYATQFEHLSPVKAWGIASRYLAAAEECARRIEEAGK